MKLCVLLRRLFRRCVRLRLLERVTSHRVRHCSTSPPALLGTDTSRLSRRPVSHSVSWDQCLAAAISTRPAATAHQHPSANLRDMKAGGFDPLFTNPHTTWYILSPTPLFAALKKSDREASQLAPSVPLLSYRRAAGCAGLKGSHWWAVLHRTKALLSNWRGPLHDDFWWITAVIVHSASSFPFHEPWLPSFQFHDEPPLPSLSWNAFISTPHDLNCALFLFFLTS